MFAKLIGGDLKPCKMPLKYNGKDVFTNDPAILRECGYKEVVLVNAPECDDGYMPVDYWVETDDTINQNWIISPIPEDPDGDN